MGYIGGRGRTGAEEGGPEGKTKNESAAPGMRTMSSPMKISRNPSKCPTKEPAFGHQPYRGNGGQQVSAKGTALGTK